MMMNFRRLVCTAGLLATCAWAQSAPTDAAITNACATLLRNAKDAKALGVIQAAAVEDTMPPALRSRAMAACALPSLQQMNTNQFSRIAQMLLSTYPEDGPAVLGVTESDWLAACPSCTGAGVKVVTCPSCAGTGKCPACKGAKKTAAGIVCQACKGEGTCGRCEDKRVIRTPCLECRSTGKVVVISPNVARRYEKVLSELRALATENIQFAEQSQKALAVPDVRKRLAALHEVIAAFPNQKDTAALIKARAAAEAAIAEEVAQKTAQDERNRMMQEKDALITAAQNPPRAGIPKLVRLIDDFIARHPRSEYETELEMLKSTLQSRHAFYTNAWRAFYILLGVIIIVGSVTTVREWVRNRNRKETLLKIPGMADLNPDEFTDPLSDSRNAAAAREANDDLGIYP